MKLVVEEAGSDLASALWDGCDAALSTRLAYPEVCAALAAGHRNHDLDDDGYALATRAWADFWAAVRPVELTTDVQRQAGILADRRSLRGGDAVHLASALAVGTGGLVMAVWDRRLHDGAVAEHLLVAPVVPPT